jgi:signal transduction histidine kinase
MVLENLLDNARKYSPESTAVTVNLESAKDQSTIRVIDQGFGIAESDIPKLFQKFSRLNNPMAAANGTGLGLYWAKKLIDLHGGELSVMSKPGKGTIFTVNIPRGLS